MKQVDFYLISNRINDASYKLASRLANKLQRLGQRCLIVTDTPAATSDLDQIMWSFSDTSFLAHDLLSQHDPTTPIQIGDQNQINTTVLDRHYDVLINLSSSVPTFSHHFQRIAEMVEAEEEAKSTARERYKQYASEGFELKTHQIEL